MWTGEAETVKDAIHAAIKARAHLSGANLSRANLSGADLSGAYRPTDPPAGYKITAELRLEKV